MKNLFSLLLLLLSAQVLWGQFWLEAGGQVMVGATGLVNTNITNDDLHDYSVSGALSYGAVLAMNIGEYHGLNLEMHRIENQQNLTWRGGSESVSNSLDWTNTDFYALYRFYAPNGMFVELGPKLSRITEVEQIVGDELIESDGFYADSYTSGVFGIGAFVAGTEALTVKVGIRGAYALTDMVSVDGSKDNFPAFYTTYNSYEESRPFHIGMRLELTFGLGGFAKGMCGQRGFVFGGTRYR